MTLFSPRIFVCAYPMYFGRAMRAIISGKEVGELGDDMRKVRVVLNKKHVVDHILDILDE